MEACNDCFSGQFDAGICKRKSRIFMNYGQSILVRRTVGRGPLFSRLHMASFELRGSARAWQLLSGIITHEIQRADYN